MLNFFLILWLLFSSSISTSFISRQKPTYRTTIKSIIFGISESKVVPCNDEFFTRSEQSFGNSNTISPSTSSSATLRKMVKNKNYLSDLPTVMIQEIFEYLLEDHDSIRLTSRHQRNSFDDLVYRTTWNIFPEASMKTFSHWTRARSQYKLIHLSQALFYNIGPFIQLYNLVSSEEYSATAAPEIVDLSQVSIKLIIFLRNLDIRECLILASSLLKLDIIQWGDVHQLLLEDNFDNARLAWSLGLSTIAREMHVCNFSDFILLIRPEHGGILAAVHGKHYALSYFMIVETRFLTFRALKEDKQYLNDIIAGLMTARFWDLLYQIYFTLNRHYSSHDLMTVAMHGDPEGLRVLRDFAMIRPDGLGHIAATYGHLEFLEELDSMGLLMMSSKHLSSGESAIHTAAFHGRTECLEFLVSRLGSYQLSVKDSSGYLPIHLASQSNNPETLKAVIRLYPFFRPRFLGIFDQGVSSPLHLAANCGSIDNAIILLQSFPELIYLKDARKETAIHIAVSEASIEMLEMLLDFASPEVIRARNSDGDTALHLAVKISDRERISILMETGHFTGFERNNLGLSPVFYFSQKNDNLSAMETFKLDYEQFTEALRIKRRKLFDF